MDLRIVPIDNGLVTVMDRDNLDAGAIYTAPADLNYQDACANARKWADKHNIQNVVDKLTRILAGETVEGLSIGSIGITQKFCEDALSAYKEMLERL